MTDIASLQIKIDSTQTKDAVDNLNMLGAASKSAEGSVNSAGKTWVKASSAAGQLRMAEAGASVGGNGDPAVRESGAFAQQRVEGRGRRGRLVGKHALRKCSRSDPAQVYAITAHPAGTCTGRSRDRRPGRSRADTHPVARLPVGPRVSSMQAGTPRSCHHERPQGTGVSPNAPVNRC